MQKGAPEYATQSRIEAQQAITADLVCGFVVAGPQQPACYRSFMKHAGAPSKKKPKLPPIPLGPWVDSRKDSTPEPAPARHHTA